MTDAKMKSNYRLYFIFGIILLVLGAAFTFYLKNASAIVLYGTGISYLIIGFVRQKKWKASHFEGQSNEEV